MVFYWVAQWAQWLWPRGLCGEGFKQMSSWSLRVLVWAGMAWESLPCVGDLSPAHSFLCKEAQLGRALLVYLCPAS